MALSTDIGAAGGHEPESRKSMIAGRDPEVDARYAEFDRSDRALLLAYLLYLGFAQHVAEEAVNEAMFELYKNWTRVGQRRIWVRVAARRIAVRKVKADRSLLSRLLARGYRPLDVQGEDVFIGDVIDLHSDLVDAVRRLPLKFRAVFALYVDGFSVAEIATLESIPERTAYERLRVARTRLQSWYEESLKKEEGR